MWGEIFTEPSSVQKYILILPLPIHSFPPFLPSGRESFATR